MKFSMSIARQKIYLALFYDNNNTSNNNDHSIFYINQNNHS